MPQFGDQSLLQLATCDERLQRIAREAIKYFDFKVIEGHRGEAAQTLAYEKGFSKTPWPYSKHNSQPSRAIDVVPWPVDWSEGHKNLERYIFMHGVIWVCAQQLDIQTRHGIDWNRNLDMRDEDWRDHPHVEILFG